MYANRQQAGRKLARALKQYQGQDVVVLALPRGGIILGAEVAQALQAPLDVVLVRKIGHPLSSEYAIGAVVLGENPVYHPGEAGELSWLGTAAADEQQVNERRYERYYGEEITPVDLKGKTVIIVDDGIATGLTMQAAVQAVQQRKPNQVVVAVPVAPPDTVETFKKQVDELVVLEDPETFAGSVGAHYRQFSQIDDEEVSSLLHQHRK